MHSLAAATATTGLLLFLGMPSLVDRLLFHPTPGVDVTLDYSHEFVVLNNTDAETDHAIQAAVDTVGADHVIADCEPAACSEDFAQMLKAKPGCYLLIGNGHDGHNGRPLHNPGYDFNDDVLAIGAAYWVRLARNLLPAQRSAVERE